MPIRRVPHLLLLIAAVGAAACAGCAGGKRQDPAPGATAPDADLPTGPVATPAGSTTTFHIRTEVAPLGSVPYDGQVLPLVSPDGLHLAVEDGDAPSWPALLGEPDAEPPSSTRLSVYDLQGTSARRVAFAAPLPLGLLLGRAADADGFLVEAPRADGSRWIGRVAWRTGAIQWLATGKSLNAHGVLTARGDLLYTRRDPAGGPASLVLLNAGGAESVIEDESGSFAFPLIGADPTIAFALVQTAGTTDIAALSLVEEPSGARRLGPVFARRTLVKSGDPSLGYQVTAPVHSSAPAAIARPFIALYHPGLRRMAAFDPREATLIGLAPKSISAAFWPRGGREGYFCTTPPGLVFTPLPTREELDDLRPRPPDARVLAYPYVARVTTHPDRSLILLGPDARNSQRLQVFGMKLDPAPPPER